MHDAFRAFAASIAIKAGSAWAFITALAVVVFWATLGPTYHYSDTWQLVINTSTTIITFLMVFVIQNTQNRDAKAIQLKLDELLRGVKGARTALVDLEDLADEDLEELQREFAQLRERYSARRDERRKQHDKAHADPQRREAQPPDQKA
jgi:low affinity Fe/Cu permease